MRTAALLFAAALVGIAFAVEVVAQQKNQTGAGHGYSGGRRDHGHGYGRREHGYGRRDYGHKRHPLIDEFVCDVDATVLVVATPPRNEYGNHDNGYGGGENHNGYGRDHHHHHSPTATRLKCSHIAHHSERDCRVCCQLSARHDQSVSRHEIFGFIVDGDEIQIEDNHRLTDYVRKKRQIDAAPPGTAPAGDAPVATIDDVPLVADPNSIPAEGLNPQADFNNEWAGQPEGGPQPGGDYSTAPALPYAQGGGSGGYGGSYRPKNARCVCCAPKRHHYVYGHHDEGYGHHREHHGYGGGRDHGRDHGYGGGHDHGYGGGDHKDYGRDHDNKDYGRDHGNKDYGRDHGNNYGGDHGRDNNYGGDHGNNYEHGRDHGRDNNYGGGDHGKDYGRDHGRDNNNYGGDHGNKDYGREHGRDNNYNGGGDHGKDYGRDHGNNYNGGNQNYNQ